MNNITLCSLLFLALVLGSCHDSMNNSGCVDTNCADYATQAEAQAAFDADPECRNDLDHDSDDKACEQHFSSSSTNGGSTNCPKTANCGCSNKNKADCPSDCCKWVVGEGCKCR